MTAIRKRELVPTSEVGREKRKKREEERGPPTSLSSSSSFLFPLLSSDLPVCKTSLVTPRQKVGDSGEKMCWRQTNHPVPNTPGHRRHEQRRRKRKQSALTPELRQYRRDKMTNAANSKTSLCSTANKEKNRRKRENHAGWLETDETPEIPPTRRRDRETSSPENAGKRQMTMGGPR